MSDFWTPKRGYKVYQNRALSKKIFNKKCPEECEWRMSDGNCDQDCNLLACLWDGDDCDGIAPDGGENLRRGFILTEGTNRSNQIFTWRGSACNCASNFPCRV